MTDPHLTQPAAPARREARLVALAVDGLVLILVLPLFVALGGLTVLLQTNWLDVDPSGTEWAWGYAVAALWLATPLVYFSIGAVGSGTAGARLLGLRVVDGGGRTVGLRRAVGRSALMYPSALLFGLGLLASMIDPLGRTLHDQLAGTMVVEGQGRAIAEPRP